MTNIHPTAVVSSSAELANDVEVGPYSVVHSNVHIGSGTSIGSHSVIHSYVKMGNRNTVADHIVLGGAPQDISYHGEETWLKIGNDNIFREFCSVHRANNNQEVTRIGDSCYLMCNTHIGHNCILGDEVIITAFAALSGHVEVGNKAIIGGAAGVHQFCRIGDYAMVSGAAAVTKDVLPFCMLGRDPVVHYKLNSIGLRRAGIIGEKYKALEKRIRTIRAGDLQSHPASTKELEILENWLAAPSKRGIYKFLR
ncbi:MAG: acyl-ACP--UDP-N-acetylglucosamine O-acyltransferase [Gammaproteobacteria bacterium]|nr:acyl-ACP--UDP-N-acetylglucosamine O-acyltransferase [Gammaproteobacteria bacterium]